MNLHDPGFLQTSGFGTGFANDSAKYTSSVQCICGYGYNFNWCLMIPEIQRWWCFHALSHYCFEGEDWGRDGKVGKYCDEVLLGCRDESESELCVVGEGRGELSHQEMLCSNLSQLATTKAMETSDMASEFCMDKGMCKARLLDDPNYTDQQKWNLKPRKGTEITCWMHVWSWKIVCQCVFSSLACGSISACIPSSWLV